MTGPDVKAVELMHMKRIALVLCGALVALPAHAQLFSQEALGGAALGGIVGGVIGHNHHRQIAEGAAIGAGAGLLLGALTHNERERQYYSSTQVPVPAYSYAPTYSYAPVYAAPARPNYAITGTALGGIAGGVIGHNHHRQTAEGIAIGAGAGLLLGAVAEQHARRQERLVYAPPTVTYAPAQVAPVQAAPTTAVAIPPTPPAPEPVPQINSYPGTAPSAMSGANSLFGR